MIFVYGYIVFLAAFLAFGRKLRMFLDDQPVPWVEPSWADEQWWIP